MIKKNCSFKTFKFRRKIKLEYRDAVCNVWTSESPDWAWGL